MTAATRHERMTRGKQAENRVKAYLHWWGKNYVDTGQEAWLPTWVHERIRYENDDERFTFVRHFPDLATDVVAIQVKDASDSDGYPTVTIEQASYETSVYLAEHDIPTLCVWWCYVDHEPGLYSNWADHLEVREAQTPRQETNGSHTPYVLVEKSCLRPFTEFREHV